MHCLAFINLDFVFFMLARSTSFVMHASMYLMKIRFLGMLKMQSGLNMEQNLMVTHCE